MNHCLRNQPILSCRIARDTVAVVRLASHATLPGNPGGKLSKASDGHITSRATRLSRPTSVRNSGPPQSEDLRETTASVFTAWVDGGAAYFAARGLGQSTAREVTLALIAALEGGFVLARAMPTSEPLLAAGAALGPRYRGVTLSPRSPAAVGPG